MQIVVPIKSVIDVELNLRVVEGRVVEEGLTYILNKWDENALEAALVLKEALGGEVTVVTIGPPRAAETMRKALAMGADRGIHLQDPATDGSDSLGYAKILAAIIARQPFDLILCGKQAQDSDMGATGIILAELLKIPQVPAAIAISADSAERLSIQRNGAEGVETLVMQLPGLITASDSLNEPRLASLRGIMQAKRKPVELLTLAELDLEASEVGAAAAKTVVERVEAPPTRAEGQKFEGDEAETTAKVMDLLEHQAKIFA